MVKIRMARFGKRNRPFFRIGVFDTRTRRDGRTIEFLGYYDPFGQDPSTSIRLDVERARYWLSVGAQPSEKVGVLLKKAGVEPPAGRKPRSKRKPKKAVAGSGRTKP